MNKPFDAIIVGELNVDLIMNQIESFPETGKEKLAENMTFTLGSSSAIVASNLSALGMKVAFIGKIGNDTFGHLCKKQLEDKGVDTSMLIIDDNLRTGATVILNFGEDRAMITHQGAMRHLKITDITSGMLDKARHLHFSSFFLQPGIRNELYDLFKMAKDAGLSTSFDAQWDPTEKWELDLKKILPLVDVFLPNETELLNLTGKQTIETAIEEIKNTANTIIIKLGNKGTLSVNEGKTIYKPAFLNEKVVDAIGAGDSFNAGFLCKFIQNMSVENAQVFGNLIGAISTTAPGGIGAFTDMKDIMKIARETFNYQE